MISAVPSEIYSAEEVVVMEESRLLDRIAVSPQVMVGKPVIKGTRLTVDYILNMLAHGETMEGILQEYEGLTREDVQACLLFAARSLKDTEFMTR